MPRFVRVTLVDSLWAADYLIHLSGLVLQRTDLGQTSCFTACEDWHRFGRIPTIFLLDFFPFFSNGVFMTNLRHTVLSFAIAAASFGAWAQTAAEHTQHHPAEPAKKASKAVASNTPTKSAESMAAMETQMKTMREMHEKMMAAKTPEERKVLMGDHMRAMQDGMSMMGKMDSMGAMKGMGADAKKGGMSMDMMGHHDMMEKRMEMMTSMMQMMMDRLPAPAAQ